MIIVKLQGGLGNQMFQYALGRALSLRTKSDVLFDKSWFAHVPDGETKRPFELDVFPLSLNFARQKDIPLEVGGNYYSFRNAILRKLPWRPIVGLPSWNFISDHFPKAQESIANICAGENVYLQGYWQSEKYFKDTLDVIRHEFSFQTSPDQVNQNILNKILKEEVQGIKAVSIHIRRGDYSSDPKTNAHHGLLSLDYYRSAMSLIEKKLPKVCYYIFSDDLAWCRENLSINSEAVFVDVNTGNPSGMDLRLMSACHHQIIANSSFSWWAAWLNANKNKIVIAPQEWLSDPSLINKDLLPENWIKLSTPETQG